MLVPLPTIRTALIALVILASTVLQAQSPGMFRRGELVRVREVAKPAVLTIVGLPDDVVQADETGVYINDVALTGFSREFLTRHKWARQVVQFDHYVVMGEERLNQHVSEYFGIHPADRIESAQ
jgi:Signal peptidase, peptidase S26